MSLELSHVEVIKDNTRIFSIDTTVNPGEVLSVIGPSGVGKSTLLNAISGQLDGVFRLKGDIRLAGESLLALPTYKRRVGLMFQDPLLFDHLNVAQNIVFGMTDSKDSKRTKLDRAVTLLEQVNMGQMAQRRVNSLSGGQQSRVALLRTLVSNPRVLLMDEPFSKLDKALRDQIREWVFARVKAEGIPAVMVTHDDEDVAAANGPTVALSANLK